MTQPGPSLCLAYDQQGTSVKEIDLSLQIRIWQVTDTRTLKNAWELAVLSVSGRPIYIQPSVADAPWDTRLRLDADSWHTAFERVRELLRPTGHRLGIAVFNSPDESIRFYAVQIIE